MREGLDVRGACLRGEDLQGLRLARLRGGLTADEWIWATQEQREMAAVHLQEVHLEKTNLQQARLAEAHLQKARLKESELQEADLRGAHLQKAGLWGASLQKAYLEGAYLQEVDLGRAELQEADLRRANLQHAHVAEADLEKADLRRANLQGVDLWKATLRDADLQGADLQAAHLTEADFQNAILVEAILQEADLRKASLQEADLKDASLQKANLVETNLQKADLRKAHLQGADLRRAELAGANLEGVILSDEKQVGPQLVDCRWGDANLAVIDWSQMKMPGDEYVAYQKKDGQGKIKENQTRLSEYEAAVRTNRQLAIALRGQGLNEKADDFAYRAQVLQWQVLQRQLLQRLDQAQLDVQKQGQKNWGTWNLEKLDIPQIFVDVLHWPSFMLSSVKLAPENFLPKRVILLILQLGFVLYLLLMTPLTLCLILLLCLPLIFIWLLGLALSLAVHAFMILLPRQRQKLQDLLTLLHLPAIEQFKHDIGSAARQTIFIARLFVKTLSGHASSILSMLLDVLTGYGYKPHWTLIWYVVTVSLFAIAYYHLGPHVTPHPLKLTKVGAVIFSITAFHGRGFFTGGSDLGGYDSQMVILGAVEAVIGLLIELSFVATFTGRFFRR